MMNTIAVANYYDFTFFKILQIDSGNYMVAIEQNTKKGENVKFTINLR